MESRDISVPSPRMARERLSDPKEYRPWIRADSSLLADTALFWLPVSSFPVREQEKAWITEFLNRLSLNLQNDFGLRGEIFFQYKAIAPGLTETFRSYGLKCMKLMGLGRFAEEELPSFPSPEEIKKMVEEGKTIDFRDWLGNYMIWFVSKQPEEQRRLFLGHGAMTTIFLPPDPKVKVPKLPFTPELRSSLATFRKIDVDNIFTGAFAMQEAFLDKSKEMFGKGLETRPEYPGIAFILPLLQSSHFFLASPELREQWFKLFGMYVNESPHDRGVLLAFQKEEYEIALYNALESMRKDELRYGDEQPFGS
ncbi:hypothetical protein [Silvibacterium dinghuense]|uniref:Uncharacterized protein n=1 Tax=Silvibacterium dinghuense TaxID=1560006 RepID=A0A4Q1SJ19_9BACT|nr:hypothetical protein [Silvibacterium dinghuense]RXS97250.1 hypothetical protein ESZ00_04880 [Silvibacterium dinghuense]GGG97470.1 hypothetical protein GCM10011586_10940 [Silvibacterium dinghuense]